MKKVFQSRKHKTHQASRSRRELSKSRRSRREVSRSTPSLENFLGSVDQKEVERRKARQALRRRAYAKREAARHKWAQKAIVPNHFSFVDNTDEVAAFYNDIRTKSKLNGKRKDVFIDFQSVERATLDAFTVLMCLVSDLHHEYHTRFVLGDIPDEEVEIFTIKSGFDAMLRGNPSSARHSSYGSFSRKASNRVEPEEAERQAEFAASQVFRKLKSNSPGGLPAWAKHKTKAAIRTLIECMSNTRGHASAHGGEHEEWWLSVYYDHERRAAEFSFVDNGVGILQSGNVTKHQLRMAQLNQRLGLSRVTGPSLLQDAVDGKIPSQTGQEGRGNGLPTMKLDCCEHRYLDDLVIIANNAKVEVGAGLHTVLRNGFAGTFIHWRVNDSEAPL